MLGSNFLQFNGLNIPNPTSFNISYENLENVAQSEAGTDLAIVTRLGKRTFECTFQSTSTWLSNFRTMCGLASGTLVYLSESITCRARITYANLAPNSEYADRTDGLWTVTVSFTEV